MAFDKVWHHSLLFKLQQHEIEGESLSLLKSYLSNRKRCVVINGIKSEWGEFEDNEDDVSQGSI